MNTKEKNNRQGRMNTPNPKRRIGGGAEFLDFEDYTQPSSKIVKSLRIQSERKKRTTRYK